MKDLYLVNYSHKNCEPLKSITQLPEKKAYELARKLYQESPCRAHRRFGPDFQYYYPHRLKTEKWLYEKFILIGGKPSIEHPFYFVLHSCDNLNKNFNYGKQTRIALKDITDSDISFTFGDSVAIMDSPERKDPISKNELLKCLASFDNDVEKFLGSIEKQYICIEAQLWTEKYSAVIQQISISDHIEEVTNLIRRSFATVANDLALTPQNASSNPAFTKADELKAYLDRENRYCFGLYINRSLCGFVALVPADIHNMGCNGNFEITRLAVLPEHRHRGYGKMLLDVAIHKAKELGSRKVLIGIIDGVVLKEYYKRYGFSQTKIREYTHLPFAVCEMELEV